MVDESSRNWWFLVLRGVCAILFGVLAFIWPGITLASLVLLFGAYALVNGAFAIAMAVRASKGSPARGAMVVLGLLSIGTAVLTVLFPGITALSLVILIAAWAIVTGVFEIVAGVQLRPLMRGTWVLVVSGALSILFGALLIVMPAAGALSLVWLIGAYAIVFGVLLLTSAVRFKKGMPPVVAEPMRA
ncbi:MAG TPA: HdeD family acid-resistance protein [Thermoanaerobaculia bacterium]|nr:HdeD family acid-resistance protein [Thermoanaerobaculia bacterium]